MVYGLLLLFNLYADEEYFKLEKKFYQQYCQLKDFNEEKKLRKDYQSKYFYVPRIQNQIDFESIKESLPFYKKKLSWIEDQKSKIHLKNFKNKVESLKDLFKQVEQEHHLFLKKEMNNFFTFKKKFILSFELFLKEYSFLTNLDFPIDHLEMRKKYEKTKNPKVFLQRKAYEDGARIAHLNDSNLRATLSLVLLNLRKGKFSYEEKRDLIYIFSFLKRISRFNESYFKDSFDLWIKKINEKILFYTQLKKNYEYKNFLHDFIIKKQIELYSFWKNKPFYYKQIFVLERLLLFEVGGINNDSFKQEILKVFFNRLKVDQYKYLEKNTDFYTQISKKYSEKELKKEHYLNALFDPGEFSFTLHFFSSSFDFVCMKNKDFLPVREDNIKLIKKFLKEEKNFGRNLWYYSRVSMYGRMNMAPVWDFAEKDFLLLGKEIFLEGDYLYWDKIGDYFLIRKDEKFYLKKDNKFYNWHDPDIFTFFYKKKT